MKKISIQEPKISIKGVYQFIVTDSHTGQIKRVSPIHENLVMNGTNTGIQLIAQNLVLDTPLQLKIDSLSIGSGVTPPSQNDVDLETPVVTNVILRTKAHLGASAQFDFFITDAQLPNGTYTEVGIFANGQIFARSIIDPEFTKASNEDVTITYSVNLSVV